MNCSKCQTDIAELPHYEVKYNDKSWHFCGRLCMVEFLAPELNKVCAPRQWVPTPDEEERMSQ